MIEELIYNLGFTDIINIFGILMTLLFVIITSFSVGISKKLLKETKKELEFQNSSLKLLEKQFSIQESEFYEKNLRSEIEMLVNRLEKLYIPISQHLNFCYIHISSEMEHTENDKVELKNKMDKISIIVSQYSYLDETGISTRIVKAIPIMKTYIALNMTEEELDFLNKKILATKGKEKAFDLDKSKPREEIIDNCLTELHKMKMEVIEEMSSLNLKIKEKIENLNQNIDNSLK